MRLDFFACVVLLLYAVSRPCPAIQSTAASQIGRSAIAILAIADRTRLN